MNDCSVTEAMKIVESIPGVEIGGNIWLFATQLLIRKEKRVMLATMKEPQIMLKWLYYEKSQYLQSKVFCCYYSSILVLIRDYLFFLLCFTYDVLRYN